MFPSFFVSNTLRYHSKYPNDFLVKVPIGTFAVFPKCDQAVTDPPITVFRCGTPRLHPGCTGPVFLRFTASVHSQVIQSAPDH